MKDLGEVIFTKNFSIQELEYNETILSSSLEIFTNWANTFLRQQKYNHSRK